MISLLNLLPKEVRVHIYDYVPLSVLVWLNKTLYIANGKLISKMIPRSLHDNYVRDMIRKDCALCLSRIVRENEVAWSRSLVYKRVSYPDYAAFLIDYCNQHESTNCKNVLLDSGMSKNRYKKNRYLNIRWKI